MNLRVFISEKLMIVLRDGRTLIGYLRTIDQFGKHILYLCTVLSPILMLWVHVVGTYVFAVHALNNMVIKNHKK